MFIQQRCGRLAETLPAMQHDPNPPEDVLKVDADEDEDAVKATDASSSSPRRRRRRTAITACAGHSRLAENRRMTGKQSLPKYANQARLAAWQRRP
jgi:hypothetical protein